MRFTTLIKYLLFFFFATLFFMYVQNVYAHDNVSGTCTPHIPNQWNSCGGPNRCEGPDVVNDWEVCFIEADGVTHTGCYTIADELHEANAPECAPNVCLDVGWGSSPGSYCGAQCVSCGVTSDRYYDSDCNCVTTGTYSDPSYCTDLCPASPSPTPSPTPIPTPSMPPPTATSKPPTPTSSPPPTKAPTPVPGFSPTPTGMATLTPIPPTLGFSPTPTRTPTPSLTPTPTFNPAACKCDGIDYTAIFSGQPVTITSYGKVEGADIPKAKIVDQKFFFAQGAETIATIIGRSSPIPATIVSSTPAKVRYASAWTLTMPELKPKATYRIWSQINCQPKLNVINYTPVRSKAVLAETTEPENLSILDRILRFLNGLFGAGVEPKTSAQPTVTPLIPVGTSESEIPTPTGRKNLQLEPIYPAEVYQKTCSFIKFRYDPPSR